VAGPLAIGQSRVVVDSPLDPSERLARFADDVERSLGDAATVVRTDAPGKGVTVHPQRSEAVGLWWMDFGFEVVLGVQGGKGGRWELDCSHADVDLLEAIVRSVTAGRVTEVKAPGRSCVTVTLEDGRELRETGFVAPAGCVPMPSWKRWGRQVRYRAYRA
jgi:hypothetical protein